MEWISVEERLPPRPDSFWVWDGAELVTRGEYFGGKRWIIEGKYYTHAPVSHWGEMQVPDPPESATDAPFYIGESSTWPHPEKMMYGIRHRTQGLICDLPDHTIAQMIMYRLNEVWVSDKGSTKD